MVMVAHIWAFALRDLHLVLVDANLPKIVNFMGRGVLVVLLPIFCRKIGFYPIMPPVHDRVLSDGTLEELSQKALHAPLGPYDECSSEEDRMSPDVVQAIMDYEIGALDFDETLDLFTFLVSSGMINSLQGNYQRTASALIQEGYI